MHVGDRGLVEKISESLLTLRPRLVRLTQLLAHHALRLFEFSDLAAQRLQALRFVFWQQGFHG